MLENTINNIYYLTSEYKILSIVIGFLLAAIESFIPILPLVAMIMTNAILFGMWKGFIISWSGSVMSTIILYILTNKFSNLNIFNKYKNKLKSEKINKFLNKSGFSIIFIAYACPFISDFFITIISGFAGFDLKTFISGMLCGKLVMFLFISYVGDNINDFFTNPIKVILFLVFIIGSWIIGKILNNRIHKFN